MNDEAIDILKMIIDNRQCEYNSDGGDCTVHTYFPFSLWNRFNCPNERGQKLLDGNDEEV
jgi:hypothetical protein